MKTLRKSLLALLVAGAAPLALAGAPIQWKTADGGNDHWYELVPVPTDWDSARAAALAAGGYLATIVSAGENTFVTDLIKDQVNRAWLGASDAGEEGTWRWKDGPEAGMTLAYQNFAPGEPNNWGGAENYLEMIGVAGMPCCGVGQWNDMPVVGAGDWGSLPRGAYVVEYTTLPVPEPGSAALLLAGLAAVGWVGRRRR